MRGSNPYFGPGGAGPETWRDHLWTMRYGFVVLTAIVVLIVVLLAARHEPKKMTFAVSERQQAWDACVGFVAERVGAPAAGAESFSNANVTLLGAGRYEVKVRYGEGFHACEVRVGAGGAWEAVSVR